MAEKKPGSREQIKQIVAQIESGIQELFQSEKYADYLRTMSRFHTYSYNNQLLIHMQMPHATKVAGFNKWKKEFGRHVKQHEKGLTIIAPTPFKKRVEEMKLDPDTKAPMTDPDGNIIMEEKEIQIPLFRPVKVFDVSQTEGRPLPSLVSDLSGNVEQYDAFMEALRRTSPVLIEIKPLEKNRDGFFSSKSQSITIREGMSQIQTVCAAVHEITHSILHNRNQEEMTAAAGDETKVPPKPKDRNTEEVEAESVSYAVCQYFGIETGANSLGYIAAWSKNKSLPELKSSLETISKTANILITSIDRHFQEICKERGIELAERDALESPSDTPERLVSDFLDLMDGLYQEGLIRKNFPKDNREQVKANLVCAVNQDATVIRNVLNQFISENTGAESAKALLERLDAMTTKPSQPEKEQPSEPAPKKGRTRPELNYRTFTRLFPEIISGEYRYLQMQSGPSMMPLHIEWIGENEVALSHTYEQNGDLMRDPEMTFRVDQEKGTLEPLTFQQDGFLARYQEVYPEPGKWRPKLRSSLNSFTQQWLKNISQQGYRKKEAIIEQGGEDVRLSFDQDGNALGPDTNPSVDSIPKNTDTTLDEYPMPDPDLTVSEFEHQTGYSGGDLLPLSKERAVALLEQDITIYAVERGENPEMLFDREDLDERPAGGMFAIPSEEWEASQDFHQAVAGRMNRQGEREQAFLDHTGDCFAIYQVRDDESLRDIRFESTDWLKSIGRTVERGNYDLAYTASLTAVDSPDAALDQLWYKFNNEHPADYCRPSLSVSDIVAIKQGGVVSCHYVDSVGFTELPGFLQSQTTKNEEMAVEDSGTGPSVADLEAQVKAGHSISLMDLAAATHREREKKSVVAQLKAQPQGQRRKKTAPKRAEREV